MHGYRFVSVAALLLLAAPSLFAATAVLTVNNITGDGNVSNIGTSLEAVQWATNPADVINGVSFGYYGTGLNSLYWDTIDHGVTVVSTAFNGGANAPFSMLSAPYQDILSGGFFRVDTNQVPFRFQNLTVGHAYQFQMFFDDSRGFSGVGGRMQTIGSLATTVNTIVAAENTADALGGVGQYVTGTFVADATTQTVPIQGSVATQLNAFQIRDITNVPEPTSMAILGLGGVAWLARRAVRRPR